MLYAVKRLGLGVGLIALASAILLLTDVEQRRASASAVLRVAILQHANTPVLDDGLAGTLAALAERGYRDGEKLKIDHFNAQGDMPTGIAIARQITSGGYDLVITSSTPSLQAVANSNTDGKVRHVFTLVADPFVAGIGLDRAEPLKHPPHLAGHGLFPPVERAFEIARRMLPALQRIGTVWNPAESNSLAFVTRARDVAKQMNLTLLEANADHAPAVSEALRSLYVRGAQALFIGGDNTVIGAIGSVIASCRRRGLPAFTILPGAPDRGTLFDIGPNFYDAGHLGGLLAADVLAGADMTKIPIRDVQDQVASFLSVNKNVLKELKDPWRIPDDVLSGATVVVDETGVHRREAPAASGRGAPQK
jgi:putative ABC transport system substrate-binding protein